MTQKNNTNRKATMSSIELPSPNEKSINEMDLPSMFRVYITKPIECEMATEVINQLFNYDELNTKLENPRPIQMIINSPGGDLFSSFMICDVMRMIQTPIQTVGLGQVISGGFLIYMTGEKGWRTAAEHTQFMSHRFSMTSEGSHIELKNMRSEQDRMHERLVNHYIMCTGLSRKKIESTLLSDHDSWLNSKECQALNVVDNIMGEEEENVGTNKKPRRTKNPKSDNTK